MANPQKENGFTPIANEILEQILLRDFNASDLKIILFVIRKTYGYHKKIDEISISQFAKHTGLSRRMVSYSLERLNKLRVVQRVALGKMSMKWIFNKNYEEWKVAQPIALVQSNTSTSAIQRKKVVQPIAHTKDILQKITKDKDFKNPGKIMLEALNAYKKKNN